MRTDDEGPYWHDLNDWIFDNHPEVWELCRYWKIESQMDLWVPMWERAGKPEIREE